MVVYDRIVYGKSPQCTLQTYCEGSGQKVNFSSLQFSLEQIVLKLLKPESWPTWKFITKC